MDVSAVRLMDTQLLPHVGASLDLRDQAVFQEVGLAISPTDTFPELSECHPVLTTTTSQDRTEPHLPNPMETATARPTTRARLAPLDPREFLDLTALMEFQEFLESTDRMQRTPKPKPSSTLDASTVHRDLLVNLDQVENLDLAVCVELADRRLCLVAMDSPDSLEPLEALELLDLLARKDLRENLDWMSSTRLAYLALREYPDQ